MFEQFSAGYYLGQLVVKPYPGSEPAMNEEEHKKINRQLYCSGNGIERLDIPLVMKVDEFHMPVFGDTGIDCRTLCVPEEMMEDLRVQQPPTLKEVLLAKSDRAQELLELQQQTPSTPTLEG